MVDKTKAFEVPEGLLLTDENGNEGPFITGGASSPVGLALSTNTIYVQNTTTGITFWQKFGVGNNDWRKYPASEAFFNTTGLTTESPDLINKDNVQNAIAAIANRAFGKSFNESFTTGTFSTSSTTFQTMQTIPSYTVVPGNYIAISHGRYLKTLLNAQVGVRMQINGTTIIDEEEIAMDDDDFYFGHTMFTYVPNLSGNVTLTSQIRKIGGGGTVRAESRTLMMWRVS